MTTPSSPMVSSGVTGATTSSSSNALKHVIENVFGWTPVNLGYMYFNDQGYNQIGDLLTMDSTKIDEMKVSVKSATKTVSMKVKKQIQKIQSYYKWKASQLSNGNMTPEDWLLLHADKFETFCDETLPRLTLTKSNVSASGGNNMTASGVTSADITDFDHGLKRDPKSYVEFNGQTSKYFRVRCQWLSTARVDCVDCIFDLNLVIPTVGTMDYSLFERQCAYVM